MSASLLTSLLLFPLSLVSGGGGVGRASVPPLRQALPLAPGSVVEVWHADRLRLGSFEGRAPPPSRALLVHLHDGQEKGEGEAEMIRIDAGQIVDVWPDRPQHPWPQVFRRAATMLSELPAHLFDLRPLWQTLLAAPAKRRAVTSTSVADVLFAPLLSPSGTPRARAHPDRAHRPADEVKGIGEGRRPRSGRADPADDETLDGFARRVAAGRLLSEERILFKRQPITLDIVKSDDAVPREAAQFADAKGPACDMWTPAMASGGGFKALQRAQVATRAQLSLTDSLKAAQRGEPIEWAPSELPVLAELEMVAIGALFRLVYHGGPPLLPCAVSPRAFWPFVMPVRLFPTTTAHRAHTRCLGAHTVPLSPSELIFAGEHRCWRSPPPFISRVVGH